MTGLIVLGLIAAYVVLTVYVVRKGRTRGQKIIFSVVAALVPFWDWPIGYLSLHTHCRTDGGIAKFANTTDGKSVYFTYYPGRPEQLLRAGLEAVEYPGFKGNVRRFVRDPAGRIIESELSKPSSRLRMRAALQEKLPWNIYRQEQILEETSGRLIARARAYSWLGGWIVVGNYQAGTLATCHVGELNSVIDETILKGSR
jgi:hypothetical protein